MARLRCARDLGVSLKRFQGWTPSDQDPVEWDDTEQAWMLALQAYEARTCPICGMSTDICHDEAEVERLYAEGRVEACFTTILRNRAVQRFEQSGAVPTEMKGAVTTALTPRTT